MTGAPAVAPVTGRVCAGKTAVALNASGSFDADGSVSQYYFDFGDGTNSSWVATAATTHTYGSPGTYTVTVKVRDDKGAVSATGATLTLTVEKQPAKKSPGFGAVAGAVAIAAIWAVALRRSVG